MERKYALLAIVVFAAGCTNGAISENPREVYNNLVQKQDDSKFHVKYSISFPALGADASLQQGGEIDHYNRKGRRKIIRSPALGGGKVTATYIVENRSIQCSEGDFSIYESDSGVSCNMGGRSTHNFNEYIKGVKRINYSGMREIAGRSCRMFTVVPNRSTFETYIQDSLKMNVCLDREKGYIAKLLINKTSESELGGADTKNILKLEVEKQNDKVPEGELEIPVPASVEAKCRRKGEVTVLPFNSYESVKLSVNGNNRSISLNDSFEEHRFNITGEVQSGNNDVTLYAAGESVSTSCRNFGYETYDRLTRPTKNYGEAETSNLNLSEYSEIEGRIKNANFSDYMEKGTDFAYWEETDGNTHEIKKRDELDGNSAGTQWESNAIDVNPASITQSVDLSDVEAVGLDVAGGGGNPHRSKIVLEVDGESQGTFVRTPQSNEIYRDLGVELNQSFEGKHDLTIKWIHVQGKNLGGSAVDNVRLYR